VAANARKLADSYQMWIRRQTLLQARMPSMRPNPSAPRPASAAPAPAAPAHGKPAKAAPAGAAAPAAGAPESAEERAARAGGFHESSYELQAGLQVSESEWPDDVTVPGALGER
jgi:hypothetical protein